MCIRDRARNPKTSKKGLARAGAWHYAPRAKHGGSGKSMASLREQLAGGDKRSKVVDDACGVLDQEVADKGGLTGIAIKGAYKIVQGVKPGFVREAVEGLLDDFLDALDPIYQEAAQKKRPAGAFVRENASRVADALLAITDRRAQKAKSQ